MDSGLVGLHMIGALTSESVTISADLLGLGGIYLGLRCGTEKAMAPHSSTPAWKIPWMEEPGGLQSMGSLRVGHD